jgi:hypothetical protein
MRERRRGGERDDDRDVNDRAKLDDARDVRETPSSTQQVCATPNQFAAACATAFHARSRASDYLPLCA